MDQQPILRKPESPKKSGPSWWPLVLSPIIVDLVAVGLPGIYYWKFAALENTYSTGMFFIIPVAVGFLTTLAIEWKELRSWSDTSIALAVALALPAIGLLVFAMEGLICLAMAAPLLMFELLIGAGIARSLRRLSRGSRTMQCTGAALLPIAFIAQTATIQEPTVRVHSSEIVINATPEQIWPYLSNLDNLPPPSEILFDVGIGHPIGVRTEGSGVGATRHCEISTGDMPEVITEWIPNQSLAFRVLQTPPTMKEVNPFGDPHPPHLTGLCECLDGRFDLVSLSDGRTLVRGTSRYWHRYGPAIYWNLWTDEIVHEVQQRVMRQIKVNAETDRRAD